MPSILGKKSADNILKYFLSFPYLQDLSLPRREW